MTAPIDSTLSASAPSILLADDDEDVRSVVALSFREQGFIVHEAADGAQLLARARTLLQRGGRIALVLSDINMPDPDGLQATRQLLALEPRLHIVLMSAFADASIVRQAKAAGAKEVLRKPFQIDRALQILEGLELSHDSA